MKNSLQKKRVGGVPPASSRFQPGRIGNPLGRPKKATWKVPAELAKSLAGQAVPVEKEAEFRRAFPMHKGPVTWAACVLGEVIQRAAAGNAKFAEIFLERAYGKVPTALEVEAKEKHVFAPNFDLLRAALSDGCGDGLGGGVGLS